MIPYLALAWFLLLFVPSAAMTTEQHTSQRHVLSNLELVAAAGDGFEISFQSERRWSTKVSWASQVVVR